MTVSIERLKFLMLISLQMTLRLNMEIFHMTILLMIDLGFPNSNSLF